MKGERRNRELSSFADPFGFGSRGSFFSSFFDRDPFDDPFFRRPFGSSFGSIFGSDGILGDPLGERSGFHQEYRSPQPSRKGPVIEELQNDHEDASGSNQEPIVEDPDDEENQEHRRQMQGGNRSGYQETNGFFGRQGPSQSFMFQSSSVTYGGPSGPYYTTSTTRRAGPNGVVEEEHREADSTTGKATQRISRGIGDKGHSFTKKRSSEGKIDTMETLHNLNEDEIAEFLEDWERKADKYLAGWKKSHDGMLDAEHSGKRNNASTRQALPSNEVNASKGEKHSEANAKKKEGQSLRNQFSRKWFGQKKA